MWYIRNNFFLLTLISASIQCVVAQTESITNESIEEAYLNKFIVDYNKGMLSANPEDIVNYYSEDIRLMPAFQKTLLGKENALPYHKAFFDRFDVLEYNRETIETLDLGGQLCVLGIFTIKVKLKASEKVEELKGKYIDIWKKESGKLFLISEIWNYNHHTPLTDDLRFHNLPGVVIAFQPHLPLDTDIRYEIGALDQLLETVIRQHDHISWSMAYDQDGIFLYSYQPVYYGRKELDPFIEKHMKELPIFEKLDVRNDRIDDFGTYVVEYASHIANWRRDDASGISTGKGIRIWKRQPNCSLKIFRQIATYD
ncbi:DUF4440 domain-containing protein [uncultured Aquimarina sp.]|uniref:YybH family protein n=1 Tax=uncultured Aquimarina sp. TaxID=575652 RepID=UPI002601DDBD|nr:DUF4440 domain-containing protein [uncultured Aquimarina sp.]